MRKLPTTALLIIALTVSALIVGFALWPHGIPPANAALAEYRLQNLTCGSCVSKIENALFGLEGIDMVDVNLTRNQGRVVFDPAATDSRSIATAIAAAGFPAELSLELSADEYRALRDEQEKLGENYLAKIGERLISRAEFAALLETRAQPGTAAGNSADQLWKTVWDALVQRELLLTAAERNGVIIQPGEVNARLEELRGGHQGFDRLIAERYGSLATFRDRLHEDMLIERNLEEHVLAGVQDPELRRARLQQWYADLQQNTEITIFDRRLKSLGQGGCGGCC